MSDFYSRLSAILEDIEGKMPHALRILLSKKSFWRDRLEKINKEYLKENPDDIAGFLEKAAAEDMLKSAKWDPTPNHRFLIYIATQIATNNIILPEDGPALKEALEVFTHKRNDWEGKNDIFAYTKWRELQNDTNNYLEQHSGTIPQSMRAQYNELRTKAREGFKPIYEKTLATVAESGAKPIKTNYKVYRCFNWQSLIVYGKGTQWCTSASIYKTIRCDAKSLANTCTVLASDARDRGIWAIGDELHFLKMIAQLNGFGGSIAGANKEPDYDGVAKVLGKSALIKIPNPYLTYAISIAQHYLADNEIYIAYKNNEPWLQMSDGDEVQIKNVQDIELSAPGPATRAILIELIPVLDNGDGRSGLTNYMEKLCTKHEKALQR